MRKAFLAFHTGTVTVTLAAAFAVGDAVEAAPLRVVKNSPAPGIDVRIKADSLGTVKLPDGTVKFSGSDVRAGAVPDWLFDRHTVLTGKLIDHRITTDAGKTTVQGLIYFLGGDWISSFPESKRQDNLELADGSILVGKMRAINGDHMDFQLRTGQTRRIKASEVRTITSPRAFFFNIPASNVKVDAATGDITGDADLGTFDTTYTKERRKFLVRKDAEPKEPKSVLAGSEGGVTRGQLAGMIMLDVAQTIAPAIVAPIVAPLAPRGAEARLKEVGIQDTRKEAAGIFVQPR